MNNVYWRVSDGSENVNTDLFNNHCMIIGGSGSGKTHLIKRVILPSLVTESLNCLILDYNGDFVDKDYIQTFPPGSIDVIQVDTVGLKFNPFVITPIGDTQSRNSCVAALAGLLADVFDLGIQQRASLTTVMQEQYKDAGIPSLITDSFLKAHTKWPNFRQLLLRLGGVNSMAANRLRNMGDLEIFSDGGSFSDLMCKTTVIALNRLPDDYTKKAVAELVLTAVYNRLLIQGKRNSNELKTNFFIIIDEAHKISMLKATDTLTREGRKFGCGVILSTQLPRDFKDDIIAQVHNRFVFKQDFGDDATFIAEKMLRGDKALAGVIRNLELGQCIFSNRHNINVLVKVSK